MTDRVALLAQRCDFKNVTVFGTTKGQLRIDSVEADSSFVDLNLGIGVSFSANGIYGGVLNQKGKIFT